ncbi:MAG: hypothetical protein JWM90_2784 [Thermoleophilia bacterium]|nr:hypothetical protein [Thermoleophilia bacterium]
MVSSNYSVLPWPNRALAYAGSTMTRVDGDPRQPAREIDAARSKIAVARATLAEISDLPIPSTRGEAGWMLTSSLDDARRAVSPYMNHDPATEAFARNEVPRYIHNGRVHPDDRGNALMNYDGSVQMHQETVLYRLPKEHVFRAGDWHHVADALTTSESIDDLLIWGRNAPTGRPDVQGAIHALDRMDGQLADFLMGVAARLR